MIILLKKTKIHLYSFILFFFAKLNLKKFENFTFSNISLKFISCFFKLLNLSNYFYIYINFFNFKQRREKKFFILDALTHHLTYFTDPIKNSIYINNLFSFIDKAEKHYLKRKVRDNYPQYEYIGETTNALIYSSSRIIIDSDGVILHDENYHFKNKFDCDLKDGLQRSGNKFAIDFNSIGKLVCFPSGINLMNKYNTNYFHFLIETVPKILFLNEKNIPKNIPLLIENNLHKNIVEILNKLNTKKRKIIFLPPGQFYKVKKLINISDMSIIIDSYYGSTSLEYSFINTSYIKKFKQNIGKFFIKKNQSFNKIYIERPQSYRNLVNQDEIKDLLKKEYNFDIIDPSKLNNVQQVSLFSNSSFIITPTGAHLANIIWMNKKSTIVVLISNHPAHQIRMWKDLATVSGAQILFVRGRLQSMYDYFHKYALHSSFQIEIDKVRSLLNSILIK